jgi:hypothetical protein
VQIAFIWDWGIGWRVDPTGFKDRDLIAAYAALIVSEKMAVRGYVLCGLGQAAQEIFPFVPG